MQELRTRAAQLAGELQGAERQVRSAETALERLGAQLAEAASARARYADAVKRLEPLAALREERDALARQAEAHAARRAMLAQVEGESANLRRIEAQLARLPRPEAVHAARERVSAARASLAAAALEAESRRTTYVEDMQEAKTKRQGLLDQYTELKEQRERLVAAGASGICPTCSRPLNVEFDNVLGVLDRQLEDIEVNGKFYKRRIEQLKEEPPELQEADRQILEFQRELGEASAEEGKLLAQAANEASLQEDRTNVARRLAELEAALGALVSAYDARRHEEVQRQVRTLEPLALEAERLRILAERADELQAEETAARQAVVAARAHAQELAERRAALGFSEPALEELRRAEAVAVRGRQDAELALVRARGESAAAAQAIAMVAQRREERVRREREIAATATDLSLHQELDRALGDLRTDLNAQLRPDLSELASAFLRDLTNGRYSDLELDENYAATLLDDGEAKAVISGGEEDVANLALRLAISQMIAERAGQPLSLLILDEIFGSLDEERRAAVVELLRSLADRFPQVILITHIDSVRDNFDRVIRVGLDSTTGVAVVREEPLGATDVAA
jgi:DNA repair protein SbcC/Rad50